MPYASASATPPLEGGGIVMNVRPRAVKRSGSTDST
jgi:hypothetical protein